MFSIIILTYNEESALPKCLENLTWCDDVVIIDSYSDDKTVEIAKQNGARVYQRAFDNFAGQRNYANNEVDYKYEWVFHLDADEILTEECKQECLSLVKNSQYGAYHVPSKMMLWNKWLKYAATYPVYQMRFHKLGEAQFEQFGHGQRECDLKRGVGKLLNAYEHHSFEKGLSQWLNRHNRYSSEEALQTLKDLDHGKVELRQLFSSEKLTQRRALKKLSFHLPARAFIKFCYMYFLKRGFLDGHPGLTYCLLHAIYEQMIVLKTKEIRLLEKGIKA